MDDGEAYNSKLPKIFAVGCLALLLAWVVLWFLLVDPELKDAFGPILTEHQTMTCSHNGRKIVLCVNTGGGATGGTYEWVISVPKNATSLTDDYDKLFQGRFIDIRRMSIEFLPAGDLILHVPRDGRVDFVDTEYHCGATVHAIRIEPVDSLPER